MSSVRASFRVSFGRYVILLATLVLSPSMWGWCQGAQEVAVLFGLRRSSVTLHEPVTAYFSIHNNLAEDVALDLGYDRESNFELSIIQPDGSTVRAPHLPPRGGMSRLPELSLRRGETYWQELLLNKQYPFSKAGNYGIGITLVTTIRKKSGGVGKAEFSQELSLDVGERDEQRLEEVCERLTRTAMLTNAEAALDAARSLSYVEDPVAVPFLARLTRQGPFVAVARGIALHGLARIARVEGVENVVSRLSPEDRKLEPEIKAEATQRARGNPIPH